MRPGTHPPCMQASWTYAYSPSLTVRVYWTNKTWVQQAPHIMTRESDTHSKAHAWFGGLIITQWQDSIAPIRRGCMQQAPHIITREIDTHSKAAAWFDGLIITP